ncbi:PTS sugar transporter subunit IIC [Lactococcus paracarnosus]|uniref:Permease IIC component n=1 Tax=Pseudolactococcus paracarnosus TaxID=2749962 RepID=A0A7L4WDI8_9LACT|nr:PTS transporter subunit EIIC [Lactococcus paracarnosus]SPC36273.1 PTS system, lactose/cellobiose IIC component family protein [Lactococcus piscium]MCJ1978288.1 PTS sugar transporter subunit IIC [Lactococcus paracarnosus]MCJ1984431.1 PTS sugar transporter subunit IIC [Lactococcus paracarnosus]MCJ1994971.1 PTS sugar transporter subunit IIC [Lactococcus paracarnosus]MCJ1998889.1 PTS sugar transporter subunit IIC [Lactococcus paracarnosus]
MDNMEKFIDTVFGPIAMYMNKSPFFRSLTDAFIRMTPLTLGASVLMIIGFFPITAWQTWIKSVGIYDDFVAVQNASINALGLFLAFTFAYCFVKINATKYNPLVAGLLSLASFMMMIPQKYTLYNVTGVGAQLPAKGTVQSVADLNAFATDYIGASGIIVAIIIGYIVARLYIFLNDKHFVITLPESVPPNVSESLSPTFIAGSIMVLVFLLRLVFRFVPYLSSYGNIFAFITGVIQTPLQNIVGSPLSLILILSLANLFWYFGIHPQVVYSVVTPIAIANATANLVAYTSGKPIPYLMFAIVGVACGTGFGGQGATLGLVISMIRAKSERYREMFKLTSIPSLFNINEPLIFGMPIILNPLFFIPMAIGPLVMGLSAWGMASLVDLTNYNPTIAFPWTTPAPITMFFRGGLTLLLISIVSLAISVVIWYPFFKIADKKALEEEAQLAAIESENLVTE